MLEFGDAVDDTAGGETVAVLEVVFNEYLFLLAAAAAEGDEFEGGAVRDVVNFESSTRYDLKSGIIWLFFCIF